jgi:hypothetical protein
VFGLQRLTAEIVEELAKVQPQKTFDPWFAEIIADGTGLGFDLEDNNDWPKKGRPNLEAFFHARTMLEFAVKYGKELENAPAMMPSGWAAFRLLYCVKRSTGEKDDSEARC